MSEAKTVAGAGDDAAREDDFNTMMDALDWFFHVAACPNHTPEERGEALVAARKAYMTFADMDESDFDEGEMDMGASATPQPQPQRPARNALDARVNAPTSYKVH